MTIERELNVNAGDPKAFGAGVGAAAEDMLNEHTARFTRYYATPRPPQRARRAQPAPKPPRVTWIGRTFGRLRGRKRG